MARRNGVDIALAKANGDGPEAYKTLANDLGITVEAIYKFRRKGWFPLDRAKVIAAKYDIPLADLVREDIRGALLDNNNS